MIPGIVFVRIVDKSGHVYGAGTRVTFANGVRVTFTSHVPKGLALRLAFEMFAPKAKTEPPPPCSPP